MKKSRVYTRTGDGGMTSLSGGVRVSKTDVRVEAYGTVDELNAHIGELITYLEREEDREFLTGIQCDLFTIGAYLATEPSRAEKLGREVVTEEDVTRLEQAIDEAEDGLPGWRGFVLPGGSRGAARVPCLPHRVPQGGAAYPGTVRKCAGDAGGLCVCQPLVRLSVCVVP